MNLSNAKGNTALHEAVVGRNEALVALLLKNGALRHLRNERSCTPADCAEPVSAARACPRHGAQDSKQTQLLSQQAVTDSAAFSSDVGYKD